MKAGQKWKMTLQNAGEGFYGYLDSPSGQNLPAPSGNTPGGAQFRLMTQAEINAQPAWLLATETKIGTAIVLVGLAIATGGTGDAGVIAIKKIGELSYEGVTVEWYGSETFIANEHEFMAFPENVGGFVENDAAFNQVLGDAPQIVEVGDIAGDEEIGFADRQAAFDRMYNGMVIF